MSINDRHRSEDNSSTLDNIREGDYRPRVQTVHYKPTYLSSSDNNKLEEEQYTQIRRKTLTTNEILERPKIQHTIAVENNLTESEQNLLDTLKHKSHQSSFIDDKIDKLKTDMMDDLETQSRDSNLEDIVTTYSTKTNGNVEEEDTVPLRNGPVPLPRNSSSEQLNTMQPGLYGVPLSGALIQTPVYNGAPLNAAPPGNILN